MSLHIPHSGGNHGKRTDSRPRERPPAHPAERRVHRHRLPAGPGELHRVDGSPTADQQHRRRIEGGGRVRPPDRPLDRQREDRAEQAADPATARGARRLSDLRPHEHQLVGRRRVPPGRRGDRPQETDHDRAVDRGVPDLPGARCAEGRLRGVRGRRCGRRHVGRRARSRAAPHRAGRRPNDQRRAAVLRIAARLGAQRHRAGVHQPVHRNRRHGRHPVLVRQELTGPARAAADGVRPAPRALPPPAGAGVTGARDTYRGLPGRVFVSVIQCRSNRRRAIRRHGDVNPHRTTFTGSP
ncbi:hypothetical protein BCEN4_1480005 [Burkholderia cenocepacia]|nr:hypothetical protein BCEN4_1480005 [Burkholderia cenocepacia]